MYMSEKCVIVSVVDRRMNEWIVMKYLNIIAGMIRLTKNGLGSIMNIWFDDIGWFYIFVSLWRIRCVSDAMNFILFLNGVVSNEYKCSWIEFSECD